MKVLQVSLMSLSGASARQNTESPGDPTLNFTLYLRNACTLFACDHRADHRWLIITTLKECNSLAFYSSKLLQCCPKPVYGCPASHARKTQLYDQYGTPFSSRSRCADSSPGVRQAKKTSGHRSSNSATCQSIRGVYRFAIPLMTIWRTTQLQLHCPRFSLRQCRRTKDLFLKLTLWAVPTRVGR